MINQPLARITHVAISALPKSFADPMPTVRVTYDNATHEDLFTYYPDEISFTEEEFIGLTRDQAFALRHKKDVDYLRS